MSNKQLNKIKVFFLLKLKISNPLCRCLLAFSALLVRSSADLPISWISPARSLFQLHVPVWSPGGGLSISPTDGDTSQGYGDMEMP